MPSPSPGPRVASGRPPSDLPLAEAKLAAPRRRAATIERPRLLRALDAGASSELTLVAAPVGYGKTTAVHEWAESRRSPVAWVTLDRGDNDPVRLWRHVAAAVDRVRQGLGRRALQRLAISTSPLEGSVDELMNGIAAFDGELVVVLDDFHSLTQDECLRSVEYGLARLPRRARLVVVSRSDPALRLAALRARGGLAELRAAELAFTRDEAETLLESMGVGLEGEELELVHERTEGWPAAVFLLGLWLRNVGDPRRAVREFGGDQRFIADYLSQELLAALDDDVRDFLLRASVLGQFTAELCDDVLGRTDSADLIAHVAGSNLFVAPLDRGWYRVHSLFAAFAVVQLVAEEPAAPADLHRRAAQWLRRRGLAHEAAAHAHESGDPNLLAELLTEFHLPLIRTGGERTLLHWSLTLPEATLLDHPELTAAAATAAAMVGQRTVDKRRLLHLADRAQQERPERTTPYAQAAAGMVRAATVDDDVGRATREGARAVELAAQAGEVLVAALAGQARALYLAGDPDGAWSCALRAVEHPDAERRVPGHSFARSTLAVVAAERGHLAYARHHAEVADALAPGVGRSRSWIGANASLALGSVLAAEGDVVAAEREIARAERFFRDEVASAHHAWLLVLLADVRRRRGRLDDAGEALAAARAELEDIVDAGVVTALAERAESELEAARRSTNGHVAQAPSGAELAVLRLLASDLSTRGVAAQLFLSPNTVRSHTRALYRKLGVNTRADAVARATTLGLLADAAESSG